MMENCKEVVDIIYEFEELIHTKKNGIVWVAYHYGKIFERFKKRETHGVGGEIRNQQIDYCF